MKKHFFIDMDGTLTESRQQITQGMESAVSTLIERGADVVVVSGARAEQMSRQLGMFITERCSWLSQNGNNAVSASGEVLWMNELNWVQRSAIFEWIEYVLHGKMPVRFGDAVEKVVDLVEDRGSQISYSAIGHNAPREEKAKYDPGGAKRKQLLKEIPFNFKAKGFGEVKVAIGGTTCIDFFLHTKGENVQRFMDMRGWKREDCVYIGDALFEGGNDHSVVGVMPTLQVADPAECESVIREFARKYA